jgi:CelD/BcsL family acetyltransferase involved in cellulose biosynthesis
MDVELITNPEALPALRPQWEDLLSRCAHVTPFMSYEWITTWWKHFGRPGALRVVCAWDQGELVGIAPMEESRLSVRGVPLFRCLSLLGGHEADYKDFLLAHDTRWQALEALLRFCQEEIGGWQLLITRGLHQNSPTNYLLPVISARLGLSHRAWAGAVCPYVPLRGEGGDTWAEYRKRGVVREYLRKAGKLQREQDARLEVAQGEEAIEEFLRLHELGWGERGGSRAITTPALREFHLDLGRAEGKNHELLVAMLYVQERAIAARYYYVLGTAAYEYLTGFDPEWKALSPGVVLLVGTLDLLKSRGYDEVDLLRGDEAYKFHFTQVARSTIGQVVAKSPAMLRRYLLAEAWSRGGN